jgi:nicotinamidase-related amidase
MPIDLAALVNPAHTAVLTSECQRSVVGDMSLLRELADAAGPALANIARLTVAARDAGAPVVHCVYLPRPDGKATSQNTRMAAALRRRQSEAGGTVDTVAAAAVVAPITVEDDDIVLSRMHGMSPMHETGLDPILRNLGVTTIVITGVSLNVAVPNITMDAVNKGYTVVIPRDAVAGVPAAYGEAMLDNTLSVLAYLTTTDELLAGWKA